jgi:hypothetical protein
MQVLPPIMEQVRGAPMVGAIHGTDDAAERFRLPLPAFVASIVRAGPLAPTATETGPTVVSERRSRG